MQATIKTSLVKSMARDAIDTIEAYRETHSGARAAQYVKVKGMLAFIESLHHSASVTITQDDYLALTQLP